MLFWVKVAWSRFSLMFCFVFIQESWAVTFHFSTRLHWYLMHLWKSASNVRIWRFLEFACALSSLKCKRAAVSVGNASVRAKQWRAEWKVCSWEVTTSPCWFFNHRGAVLAARGPPRCMLTLSSSLMWVRGCPAGNRNDRSTPTTVLYKSHCAAVSWWQFSSAFYELTFMTSVILCHVLLQRLGTHKWLRETRPLSSERWHRLPCLQQRTKQEQKQSLSRKKTNTPRIKLGQNSIFCLERDKQKINFKKKVKPSWIHKWNYSGTKLPSTEPGSVAPPPAAAPARP